MNKGVFYAIAAYAAWGLLPLYWKLFQSMSPWEILGNRIIWSFGFVMIILLIQKRWKSFTQVAKDKRSLRIVCISSVFISINWLIYIWAVNSDHVIEASLGYYMNPLFNVCLGVLFLKERLHLLQWMALGIAAIGVLILTVQYGHFPWIALSLALSFGLYGLVKKKMSLESMIGLAWETTFVFPISLVYVLILMASGHSTVFTLPAFNLCLLLLAGVATAMPLLWFAQATKFLRLSTVGLFQYLSPTISLILGILVFHESFTRIDLICFGCIWVSLVIYTLVPLKKPVSVIQRQRVTEQISN
jgi:chloramphenicol-sensitive protein RarD